MYITKYQMLNKSVYRDLNTGKLISGSNIKHPSYTFVPPYLRGDKQIEGKIGTGLSLINGNFTTDYSVSEIDFNIRLNSLTLGYQQSSEDVNVAFWDSYANRRHSIVISQRNYKAGEAINGIINVEKNGIVTEFRNLVPYRNMKKVRNMHHIVIHKENVFEQGFVNRYFKIKYKDDMLKGESLCYLEKMWGILLQDDLKLDAIFILGGTSADTITVDDFVFSSNPYIIKEIILRKGGKSK